MAPALDWGHVLAALPAVAGRRRQVDKTIEEVRKSSAPLSLGTTANMESEVTQVLQAPRQDAGRGMREAAATNLDETSWGNCTRVSAQVFLRRSCNTPGSVAAQKGDKTSCGHCLGGLQWYVILSPWRVVACCR